MTQSRYPEPGTLTWAYWEDENYKRRQGKVAIMATSRHKKTISEEEALEILKAEYGPYTTIADIVTWRSVTREDRYNLEDEDWAVEGSGQAWVMHAQPCNEVLDEFN